MAYTRAPDSAPVPIQARPPGRTTRQVPLAANAQWLKGQVDAAPDWECLAPVPLQTVSMRHRPPGVADEAALTAHNLEIAARVNAGGRAYVTGSALKGIQTIRVSIGAEATGREHVETVWRELNRAARD